MTAKPAPVRKACTQAEFARQQGWGKSYVSKLKAEGRLVITADELVDIEASLALIRATTAAPERASAPAQGIHFADAAEREKFYASELKRLDYEAQIGLTAEMAQVRAVCADLGTRLRGALEAWPERLSPMLAAAGGDEERIAAILAEEVELRLSEISRGFSALASAAGKEAANG